MYQAGAVLRVASARNGKTEGFIYPAEPCARGISAYCASSRGSLVALARRSVPPVIDVLCWPGAGAAEKDGRPPYKQALLGRERRAMARGGAGLEYGALALSRNGLRLAAISSIADAVLTVWDVPKAANSVGSSFDSGGSVGSIKQITSGGELVEPLEAAFLASVELPTACDTVSFNPANPNMLLCTATSAHHDGVGGGHGGGCFIYKLSTSHGHTSLTLVECNLTSLPDPHEPSELDEAGGEDGDGSQMDDESGWGTRRTNGGADRTPNDDAGSAGSMSDDDEDDDHAALQGHHSHAHGRLSVGAAVWGPGDVVYLGTGAGVVGRFDAATGALQCAWARGSSDKIAPSSVVGLVLTKDFLVVASKSRMLYWLDSTELGSVEHTATVFGISNGAPPERIARLGHSPNYRYLVVATAEGTLHSHAIEPPADESKRSVSTGMPDILPISNDFHDGFVLCAASLAVARRGVQSDTFFTGGSDGTVRGWWAEDSTPAVARVFRALHPYDEDDDASSSYSGSDSGSVGSVGSRRSSRSQQPGSGGAVEGIVAGSGGFDTEDGNQALDEALQGMAEVQEDGSEHSNEDDDDDDNSPDALSPVAVTSLAALPGRPVLAVGLADGQLSLLLAHAITPLHSNGSLDAQLELLPLDLKQFSRRPVTHLAFSTPRRKEQVTLLAAGCATDGTIHIVEMAEPSEFKLVSSVSTSLDC